MKCHSVQNNYAYPYFKINYVHNYMYSSFTLKLNCFLFPGLTFKAQESPNDTEFVKYF